MKVKICGLMNAEDAAYAAGQGCDYIGINFYSRSKRYVGPSLGKEIAAAARLNGAEPVAILVDEPLEEILAFCRQAHIKTVQLHGERARSYCKELLEEFSVIYAIPVKPDGSYENPEHDRCIYLFDNLQGGSGKSLNWDCFTPPTNVEWFLAGGLNPDNVKDAITKLQPHGVDVASGVEVVLRKSPELMKQFIKNAKGYL